MIRCCLSEVSMNMKLAMVPSIRSRRVVLNGGPHLSVDCMWPYFMKVFTWLSAGCLLRFEG